MDFVLVFTFFFASAAVSLLLYLVWSGRDTEKIDGKTLAEKFGAVSEVESLDLELDWKNAKEVEKFTEQLANGEDVDKNAFEKALSQHVLEVVHSLMLLELSAQKLQQASREGYVAEDVVAHFNTAKETVDGALKDIQATANTVRPGWADVIIPHAIQEIRRREQEKQMKKKEEEKKEEEKKDEPKDTKTEDKRVRREPTRVFLEKLDKERKDREARYGEQLIEQYSRDEKSSKKQ